MYEFLFNSLQFPVPPEKLKMKISNQNETMNLISGQEINIPKVPGLTEIEFSLLLPAVKYPFAVYPNGFQTPDFYTNALKELKEKKQPFQFIVNRKLPNGQYSFDNNITVLLEEYAIEEDAGNGYDLTVDIKLKQYAEYGTKIVKVSKNTASNLPTLVQENKRPTKEPEKSYNVKSGDTLWGICKKSLGDGSKYSEIMRINGIKNPNEILAGQVIRLA